MSKELSVAVGQLLEGDWRGELGRAVEEVVSADHGGPVGRVHAVPEEVGVAVGAERGGGVGHAVRLRAQPPAAAAGAVGAGEADGGRIGAGGQAEGIRNGVGHARQLLLSGHVGPEGAVEGGGEFVQAVGAISRRAEHAHPRHAPHGAHVDDAKLRRSQLMQRLPCMISLL